MSEIFKDLLGKAADDIEACILIFHVQNQHDNAGGHLAKAAEKLFKAYLELCSITNYPKNGKDGHDMQLVLKMLSETDFPVTEFTSLLKLQVYDSASGYFYTPEEKQVNLKTYLAQVDNLKTVVLRKYKEISKTRKR